MKKIALLLLFPVLYSFAVEKEYKTGADSWKYSKIENLEVKQNEAGEYCLVLRDGEYVSDNHTQLLLHFNEHPGKDKSGNFTIENNSASISSGRKKYGAGAGLFNGERDAVILVNTTDRIFPENVYSGDFTIEFWLYGLNFSDGETVFLFDSYVRSMDQFSPQFFKTYFSDRKLVWHIKNFFLPYDRDQFEIVLKGDRRLIPGTWSHHLVRYRSDTGLMEYLIDGVPDAVIHVNRNTVETGEYYPFYAGTRGRIVIGDNFTGLLDQFRIKSEWTEKPELSNYRDYSGYFISETIDLGHSKSIVTRIDPAERKPAGTAIRYYYYISDTREIPDKDSNMWKQFNPGAVTAEGGRFLRIKTVLYSDGNRDLSPQLSHIKVKYTEQNPPHPPRLVKAEPKDRAVRIVWTAAADYNIDGYLVYFGEQPGRYFGKSSSSIESPVDAGLNTEITIDNLENGRIYYFSVVPYHYSASSFGTAVIKMGGRYSKEVSARPLAGME